jgi:CheY-like chemotaxis protein
MQQCGGHLVIESKLDVGTRVSLFFPWSAEVVEEPTRVRPGNSPPDGGREKILLVEDEPLVRLGVAHILREFGYAVTAVKDATAALKELDAGGQRFHLLLTDVVLPGMSGPELTKVAHEKNPGIRVLLMSAFPAEELVAQGRIVPGTPTLEKPFSDDQLFQKIRDALTGATS